MRASILTALLCLTACSSSPPQDITDAGQLLFLGYAKKEVNCSRCHGPDGRGGLKAPDIRNATKKYTDDEILDFIDFGKGKGKDAMPPFEDKLTESELQSLLRFLKTLPSDSTELKGTPQKTDGRN